MIPRDLSPELAWRTLVAPGGRTAQRLPIRIGGDIASFDSIDVTGSLLGSDGAQLDLLTRHASGRLRVASSEIDVVGIAVLPKPGGSETIRPRLRERRSG